MRRSLPTPPPHPLPERTQGVGKNQWAVTQSPHELWCFWSGHWCCWNTFDLLDCAVHWSHERQQHTQCKRSLVRGSRAAECAPTVHCIQKSCSKRSIAWCCGAVAPTIVTATTATVWCAPGYCFCCICAQHAPCHFAVLSPSFCKCCSGPTRSFEPPADHPIPKHGTQLQEGWGVKMRNLLGDHFVS